MNIIHNLNHSVNFCEHRIVSGVSLGILEKLQRFISVLNGVFVNQ